MAIGAPQPCEDCEQGNVFVRAGAEIQARSVIAWKNGFDVQNIATFPGHSETGIYKEFQVRYTYNIRDELGTIIGTCDETVYYTHPGNAIVPHEPRLETNIADGCGEARDDLKESELIIPDGAVPISDQELREYIRAELDRAEWGGLADGDIAHFPGGGILPLASSSDGGARSAQGTEIRFKLQGVFDDLIEGTASTVFCVGGDEAPPQLLIRWETDRGGNDSEHIPFDADLRRFSDRNWRQLRTDYDTLDTLNVPEQRYNLRRICFTE